MIFIFEHLRAELPYLREKLIEGQVDGTQYEGECACLLGTIGKGSIKCINKIAKTISFYEKGLHNPCEQWFWNIREGDTPNNNFFAKHAVKLIDQILDNQK
jgi:hypothetical protein